jgi:phytoene dehydrogenase-like protein
VPTLHDPELAPDGEHLVICTSLVPYDIGTSWDDARERYTEELVGEVERVLPGFSSSLTFVESATPLTLERYMQGFRGAIYSGFTTALIMTGHQSPEAFMRALGAAGAQSSS